MAEKFSAPIARLARAISIPTVNHADTSETDFGAFDEFLRFLPEAFPLFHEKLTLERVGGYSLLYHWPGRRAEDGRGPAKLPVLLMAHYDVVPADGAGWEHPPFSGEVSGGFVWGRGTLDIKSQLTAHMEAVEALIRRGFTPDRDIYFAYGHDEETGGDQGADKIAALLADRGLRFDGVLDEGGLVVTGALAGVDSPVALIGLAEKGRADFEITVRGRGGHSSMPPASTALGRLAEVICRVERHPMPTRLTKPVLEMLNSVSREMGFFVRLAVKHLWLFGGLLKKILAKSPETNSMIRTTFAATMAKASDASNVLPLSARACINVRLLEGDTIDSVTAYLKKLAGGIPIEIHVPAGAEATPASPTDGAFYSALAALIGERFPGALIAPYLMSGGTDSRKYSPVCDRIYRFTPIQVTNEEKDTVHNVNERISVEGYLGMIKFFETFIERL
jgi:carboxypeptidase PM20D1